MNKIILILMTAVILACGGSDGSSPVTPGGSDPDPNQPVNSPVDGSWTVTQLEIIEAGDTMSAGSPNAAGTAVFTDTDADVDVGLFGQPTIDEAGPYTFDTASAVLTIQTDRGARTWDYTVVGDVLTLEGIRSSGTEQLRVKITASR